MKKQIGLLALAAAVLLSGCGSFLDRDYSVSAPHSSSYFSSDDPSVLRVEGYQELVNGLLMLVASRAEAGTSWLYPSQDITAPGDAVERACHEVQQDTPLGSYTVEYLTYTIDEGAHNYSAISLTIGYRRSAEQIAAMVHATNLSALPDLLAAAARGGATELVIQLSYFDQTREEVLSTVSQVQQQLLDEETAAAPKNTEQPNAQTPPPEETEPWQVNFYPHSGDVGIIEILLGEFAEKNA